MSLALYLKTDESNLDIVFIYKNPSKEGVLSHAESVVNQENRKETCFLKYVIVFTRFSMKMHQPYKVCQLLKLPLDIESIKAYGDHLLVGTKQGHLLMYSVAFNNLENEESDKSDNSPNVQLLRSNKNFSKKAILKLEAVPDYSILVTLSDSVISVHDIDLSVTNFPVITSLTRTKGVSKCKFIHT